MRHCFWVRPREDLLSWYILADCLPPRYQMKTKSRLTKRRARSLDISALQHRTAKFAICSNEIQTIFFSNHNFFFFQARIQNFLKAGVERWRYTGMFFYGCFQFIFLVALQLKLIHVCLILYNHDPHPPPPLPRSTHVFTFSLLYSFLWQLNDFTSLDLFTIPLLLFVTADENYYLYLI